MHRRGLRSLVAPSLTSAALALTGCGRGPAEAATPSATTAAPVSAGSTTTLFVTTTATVQPTTTVATPTPTTPTTPTTTTTTPFSSTIAEIDDATAARMAASWRPGCPVPLADLRLLTLTHLGFDGGSHRGELVVHADAAAGVAGVFEQLYATGFPIERMELVDVYGADDDRSTMANNTSAFNCRAITGGSRWSEHAYGRAIDINPVQNPYVYSDGHVLDPKAAPYTDRGRVEPGMIHPGDAVASGFAAIGWSWGGDFTSIKDYQHFSATGR